MSAVSGGTRTSVPSRRRRPTAAAVIALLCGLVTLALGVWSLTAPESFAAAIAFPPYNEHLLHDLGAFQIGLGVGLLLAPFWSDALGVALAGFAVGGGLHAVNDLLDRHLGGHEVDQWALGALALLALTGLVLRVRAARRALRTWWT